MFLITARMSKLKTDALSNCPAVFSSVLCYCMVSLSETVPLYTVQHENFAGSYFCGFCVLTSIRKNYFSQNKNPAK